MTVTISLRLSQETDLAVCDLLVWGLVAGYISEAHSNLPKRKNETLVVHKKLSESLYYWI